MLSLLWECIIGMVVGAVAKFLMPGKDPGGIFITMIIGIAGWILTIPWPVNRLVSSRPSCRLHHVSGRRDRPANPVSRNPRRNVKSLAQLASQRCEWSFSALQFRGSELPVPT